MKSIFKYLLVMDGAQSLDLPKDSIILSVLNQYDTPVLYALVDDDIDEFDKYEIYARETGHDATDMDKMNFINTVSFREGYLIFHYFYSKMV